MRCSGRTESNSTYGPSPWDVESMCAARSVEPNGSPSREPPRHQPAVLMSSGTSSRPSASVDTARIGTSAPLGSRAISGRSGATADARARRTPPAQPARLALRIPSASSAPPTEDRRRRPASAVSRRTHPSTTRGRRPTHRPTGSGHRRPAGPASAGVAADASRSVALPHPSAPSAIAHSSFGCRPQSYPRGPEEDEPEQERAEAHGRPEQSAGRSRISRATGRGERRHSGV